MTREEAIKVLQSYAEHSWGDLNDVFEMAIHALRKQDVTGKDVGKMTNADRIRAMSDEELAGFLMKLMHNNVQCFGEGMFPYHPCPQEQNCKQCGLDWLQQPAEEDDHDERKENENV